MQEYCKAKLLYSTSSSKALDKTMTKPMELLSYISSYVSLPECIKSHRVLYLVELLLVLNMEYAIYGSIYY